MSELSGAERARRTEEMIDRLRLVLDDSHQVYEFYRRVRPGDIPEPSPLEHGGP